MEYTSTSTEETEALGQSLAKTLAPGTLLALRGDLGAGKTAFVRGLAAGLGYHGRVTSPTFTIVNEYEGTLPLFHFDLYRLGSEDELYDIGFDEYLARCGVCAVEWSERAPEIMAAARMQVTISRLDETSRRIVVEVRP
jgi:ATPase, YjeE family